VGRETDAVAFFAALAEAPYRYDFYQTLRRVECLYATRPRWGRARRPADEPLRLGQDPDLTFAPAPLAALERGGAAPRLQVRLFGLLGPNGPLPLHVTEYARDRLRHGGDATLSRFLDLLHHRFIALFYRAWAQAQPHVNRDRPDEDRFSAYIGSFAGVSTPPFRRRDSVPDLAKFFHVAALVSHTRHAEGLASILREFFRVPARLQEFVGHWLPLSRGERTTLHRHGSTLGGGAVLGSRVWDRQHKFRIQLGPLTFAEYESFLPPPRGRRPEGGNAGANLRRLVDWVRLYVGFEFAWDVRLVLKKEAVPVLRLGSGSRLGWTTWLGDRRVNADADDLCLDAEAFVGPAGVPAV
jgi:type VI secretion system protein ImpH